MKKQTKRQIKNTKPEFRIQGKKLFLTFARCNLELKEFLVLIEEKLSAYKIIDYLIVREEHEIQAEKGLHIHAYFNLEKKFDTKNIKFFDLILGENEIYHPNIQVVKNVKNTINYLLKDQIERIGPNILISEKLNLYISDNYSLMDFYQVMIKLAKKGLIKQAMNVLEENSPSQFLKSGINIEKNLNSIYARHLGFVAKFSLKNFILPEGFQQEVNTIVDHKKTVYLLGASATGKTAVIQAIVAECYGFKPLIVNNLDGLRGFNSSLNDCIIFDDVDFSSLKNQREKLIHILDSENEATIEIKHSTIFIPKNIQRFIVSNKSLKEYVGDLVDLKEINRRFKEINIGNFKMYTTAE